MLLRRSSCKGVCFTAKYLLVIVVLNVSEALLLFFHVFSRFIIVVVFQLRSFIVSFIKIM